MLRWRMECVAYDPRPGLGGKSTEEFVARTKEIEGLTRRGNLHALGRGTFRLVAFMAETDRLPAHNGE